jgi:hypothetical protein
MGIETNFKFAHRQALTQEATLGVTTPVDLLGPLRALVGDHGKKTWKGTGFNMIWRPNHGQTGTKDFFLELNQTQETLDFTDITGTGVGNRGSIKTTFFLERLPIYSKSAIASGRNISNQVCGLTLQLRKIPTSRLPW